MFYIGGNKGAIPKSMNKLPSTNQGNKPKTSGTGIGGAKKDPAPKTGPSTQNNTAIKKTNSTNQGA